jgi:hypothetical protein
MRMAQTRGGKRDWIACESSTKGCGKCFVSFDWGRCEGRVGLGWGGVEYHKQGPDGIVGEDGAGEDEHSEAYEAVELLGWVSGLVLGVCLLGEVGLLGCWRPCWRVCDFLVSFDLFVCSSEGCFSGLFNVLVNSIIPSIRFPPPDYVVAGARDQLAVKSLGILSGFPCDRPTVCHYRTSNNNPLSSPPPHHPYILLPTPTETNLQHKPTKRKE